MAKATETIACLSVPADEDVPAEARELWEKPLEKLGFVPNVLRVMALRPEHLVTWWAYMQELMTGESGLTKAQREMIAVVVSVENRCHYCVVSHSAALRKLTGDPVLADQIATNYRYAPLELGERAMLDYAVKLTPTRPRAPRTTSRSCGKPAGATRTFSTSPRSRRCSISQTGSRAVSAGFQTASISISVADCVQRPGQAELTSGGMVVTSCEHPC